MATFALVHGAWLGAWCWERLIPELEALGHRVIVMDLPVDNSAACFDDYAEVVCAAIEDVSSEGLILVGHSMGGQTIPLVAARRPVRRLVYVCGVPPIPQQRFAQQMADESDMLNPNYARGLSEMDDQGRRCWIDEGLTHFHVFGDCDDATASAAFARLRPQSTAPYQVPCTLSAHPAVDTTFIVCESDRMVNPDWSRRIAHQWLQADVIELPGGHSPFYSRPRELAEALNRLA